LIDGSVLMSFNIAIDGPAGAGKSTIAKVLAEKLNMSYVDTGAMYRAVTLKAIRSNELSEDKLKELSANIKLDIRDNRIYLDGEDVTCDIRSPQVTEMVSYIAKIPSVRKNMVKIQKKLAEKKGIIMDGRDIGTTVLPDAEFKFFLTADLEERAKRRSLELAQKGHCLDIEKVKKDIQERDSQDMQRTCSPLKVAPGARIIDTTNKTIDQVVEEIMAIIRREEQNDIQHGESHS